MRVIHIVKHSDRTHGNAQVAVDLACEQARVGHEVIYASRGGSLAPLLEQCGVRLEPIVQEGGARNMLASLLRFARLCAGFRPAVIHAHMMSSALYGLVGARVSGARLVATVHNSFDRHSALMRIADLVVAVSSAERDALVARGFPAKRMTFILNGPSGSARERWGEEASVAWPTPCVAMVCGLHARKGVGDVLKAFRAVQDAFPDWSLNIIGDGPDRKLLEQFAQDHGIRAHFVGYVDRPQDFLQKSDIYVSASLQEPCGLSIIEARVAGCAMIGSAVGGTPELLEFGRAGRLVSPRDPDQLAGELRRLMGDPATLRRYRAAAADSGGFFRIERLARDYESAYLAARKRAGERLRPQLGSSGILDGGAYAKPDSQPNG